MAVIAPFHLRDTAVNVTLICCPHVAICLAGGTTSAKGSHQSQLSQVVFGLLQRELRGFESMGRSILTIAEDLLEAEKAAALAYFPPSWDLRRPPRRLAQLMDTLPLSEPLVGWRELQQSGSSGTAPSLSGVAAWHVRASPC
jgi:hypothetical protein